MRWQDWSSQYSKCLKARWEMIFSLSLSWDDSSKIDSLIMFLRLPLNLDTLYYYLCLSSCININRTEALIPGKYYLKLLPYFYCLCVVSVHDVIHTNLIRREEASQTQQSREQPTSSRKWTWTLTVWWPERSLWPPVLRTPTSCRCWLQTPGNIPHLLSTDNTDN